MASTIATYSFRWLDLLEKEFDKSYVDLNLILNEIDSDADPSDTYEEVKEKLSELAHVWSQLVHKTQTIFQINCKLEAQILDLKSDLFNLKASNQVLLKESDSVMIELHTLQLKYQSVVKNIHEEDSSIIKKLHQELDKRREDTYDRAATKAKLDELTRENDELKVYIVNLQSEVYGARLAAKYLDKELSGRIQQIQLLGKHLDADQHERLWTQLEAEIQLHRHKTVIKACRSKKGLSNHKLPAPSNHDFESLKKHQSDMRLIELKRNNNESIGISITGGKEHGVPILISEIHKESLAYECKQLYVGDAILAVNDIDLKNARHSEAVSVLSSIKGDVKMKVLFVAPDYDSSDYEDNSSLSQFDYPFTNNDGTNIPRVIKNYFLNKRANGQLSQRSRSNSIKTADDNYE